MATNHTGAAPRAVIHKRILEAAEARPDASMAELAADLAGASPALVERVLEEYGDPGLEPAPEPPAEGTADGSSATHPAEEASMSEDSTPPTAEALTDKQREALRAIAKRPEATQAELAEQLGVSRATVNQRVNGIEGFEWRDRRAFVERVFGEEAVGGSPASRPASPGPSASPADRPTDDAANSDGGQLLDPADANALEQLQERLARVERRLGEPTDERPIEDTELLAKVLRAVLADEAIDADEALRVIEALR